MSKGKKVAATDTEAIQKALGAQRVVSLEGLPSQGPLDFQALREAIKPQEKGQAKSAAGRSSGTKKRDGRRGLSGAF